MGTRKRNHSEWATILGRYRESGLTQREFCQRESVSPSVLRNGLYGPKRSSAFVDIVHAPVGSISGRRDATITIGDVEHRVDVHDAARVTVEILDSLAHRRKTRWICIHRAGRVLLFAEPTDRRKGHNGLQVLVLEAGEDPFSGALFVFIFRRRDRAKILVVDGSGLVLGYKRLERGRFRHPKRGERNVELDATSLAMLLDGIDVNNVRRPHKWAPCRVSSRKDRQSLQDVMYRGCER